MHHFKYDIIKCALKYRYFVNIHVNFCECIYEMFRNLRRIIIFRVRVTLIFIPHSAHICHSACLRDVRVSTTTTKTKLWIWQQSTLHLNESNLLSNPRVTFYLQPIFVWTGYDANTAQCPNICLAPISAMDHIYGSFMQTIWNIILQVETHITKFPILSLLCILKV